MRRFVVVLVVAALIGGACSDDAATDAAPDETLPEGTDTTTSSVPADEPEFAGTIEIEVEAPDRCEPVGATCLLPFPSDAHTVDDPTRSPAAGSTSPRCRCRPPPREAPSTPVGRTATTGFSPGSAALVLFPGIDPDASNLPPITDLGRSLAADSAVS